MPRSLHRAAASAAACIALATFIPSVAHSAQRTFVASSGSDANVCTLAAPCRSFGTAIGHTDPDGEIVVLDSAGYGRVTIDKSVSIIAPAGIYAGISAFAGTNGVDVAGISVVVVLRGLAINGQGGDIGIRFTQGLELYIEQCIVANMGGRGISLESTGLTHVTDSTIRDSGNQGIWIESGRGVIDRTRIERSLGAGLRVLNASAVTVTNSVISGASGGANGSAIDIDVNDGITLSVVTITESNLTLSSSAGVNATVAVAGSSLRLAVARSTLSKNGSAGVFVNSVSGALTAIITDNTITGNGNGIRAQGASVIATVANNAVSGNTNGLAQFTSALLKTRSNNVVQDNTTDTVGTLTFVGGD